MDRRTLLFVILFTLTLLGVNLYFDSQRQEDWRQWNKERTEKLIQKRDLLLKELQSRYVPLSKLPVKQIYSDEKLTQLYGIATEQQEALLVLPDEGVKTFPQTLYTPGAEGAQRWERYWYEESSVSASLYSKNGKEQPFLDVGEFNFFNEYPLVIVTRGANGKPFQEALAEYREGSFVLPADKLIELNKGLEGAVAPVDTAASQAAALPTANGIVFMKQEGRLLPVALFEQADREFLPLKGFETLSSFIRTLQPSKLSAAQSAKKEEFFVLENGYQQLVFSSKGAALVEINLTQRGEANPESLVKPIEADRAMVETQPQNALFPSHPYKIIDGQGQTQEHMKGKLGGYYPLLRRDLIEQGKHSASRVVPPQFYSTNIVSHYPEVSEQIYQVVEFTKDKIVFEVQQSYRRIRKIYTFEGQAPYCFSLELEIEGDKKDLWLISGVPDVEMISNAPAPALKYRIKRPGKGGEVRELDLPTTFSNYSQSAPQWMATSNGFFAVITTPLFSLDGGFRTQYVSGELVPSRLMALDSNGDAGKMPGYTTLMPLEAGRSLTSWRFFAGPLATSVLEQVDSHYSSKGENPDYLSAQSYHGYFEFISAPFAQFLFFLMRFFHAITGSWGIAIILLTVALRILLYPLNAWSLRSSQKTQQLMPAIQAIQERYKKEPKKVHEKTMQLYREAGVNPLSGCVPVLIQIPFLIGMFDLLKTTFVLRGACFIPGWIDNLAAPDVLFSWQTPLPLIGNQFHLLPILSGVVMFFQQRMMSPSPSDPAMMTDKQRQQRAAGTIMAVFFTFIFYSFPSGINIYWISSSLIGILQQWITKRRLEAMGTVVKVDKVSKAKR